MEVIHYYKIVMEPIENVIAQSYTHNKKYTKYEGDGDETQRTSKDEIARPTEE